MCVCVGAGGGDFLARTRFGISPEKNTNCDDYCSIDARIDGVALPGKHWFRKRGMSARSFFWEDGSGSYMKVENLQGSDSGLYRCRVDWNGAPEKTYKIRLEVKRKANNKILFPNYTAG